MTPRGAVGQNPCVEPPPPPKKSRWPLWKILVVVIGIPVGLLLLLLSCGVLYEMTASEEPATERDLEIVLTAEYVGTWVDEAFEVDLTAEKAVRRTYIDGAIEVEYENEHPIDEHYVYIYCLVIIEEYASDARLTYTGYGVGESIGMSFSDVTLDERNDLFSWGSKSSCSLMRSDETGEPVGNQFSCLTGRKVVSFSLSGIYFDDGAALREFLSPVLEQVDRYRP